MSALYEMVNGKRVVFVGPATYMERKGRGKQIDSQDVVIRMNDSFPIPGYREIDYGKRCDIFATNGYFLRTHYSTPQHYKDLGVKLLLLKTGSQKEIDRTNEILPAMKIKLYPDDPLLVVSYTGAFIMEMIKECKPLTFWITGIDFYLGDPCSWWFPEYKVL